MVLGPRFVNASMVNVTMALVSIMDVMNILWITPSGGTWWYMVRYFHET